MKKLNIVVIGYYGKLNAGDDILMQAISYLFKEHNLMFTSWFPGLSTLNSCDLVLVGGGSIWPGNNFFQLGDDLIRKLKTPYMIIGVSTKNANDTILAKNKLLIDNAALFLVRDSASKLVLGNSNKIMTGTDLFWTMPYDIDRSNINKNFSVGVNFRLWHNDVSDYKKLTEVVKSFGEVIPFPMYFGSQIHESSATLSDVELLEALNFDKVFPCFSVKALEQCHVMVAMRFHSVLMSVRAGIPTVGFDYHPKVKSFFEENGLGRYCINLNDADALNRLISDIRENYDSACQEFKVASGRLINQGLNTRALVDERLSLITKKEVTFKSKLKGKIASLLAL